LNMCMIWMIQLSGKLECADELNNPHAWQAWICAWYAWHEPVAPLCPPCRWSINKSNFKTFFLGKIIFVQWIFLFILIFQLKMFFYVGFAWPYEEV
jgi:hypothetical protein